MEALNTRPQRNPQFQPQQTLKLQTNYFEVNLKKAKNQQQELIYVYALSFDPDDIPDDSRKKRSYIVYQCYEKLKDIIGDYYLSGKVIFATKLIEQQGLITIESFDRDKNPYVICLTYTNSINLGDLYSFKAQRKDSIQMLNVLLKRCMKLMNLKEFGKNCKFYDIRNEVALKQYSLRVLKGFLCTIDIYSQNVLLQIDCSSRILRTKTLLVQIQELLKYKNENQIIDELYCQSVIAYYGNYRIYRIHDIRFDMNPMSQFEKNGELITYREYYKIAYGIDIKEKNQPLVYYFHEKQQKEFFLIPELLYSTGLNDNERNDFKLMKDLAEHTKLNAGQRKAEINNHYVQIKKSKSELDKFNIELNEIQLNSMILKTPNIIMKENPFQPVNGLFQQNIRQKIKVSKSLLKEQWVFLYDEKDYDFASECFNNMIKAGKTFGITVQEPYWIEINQFNDNELKNQLTQNKIFKSQQQIQIVVSLLPNNKKQFYSKIKNICNNQLKIPSQNILSGTLKKGLSAVSNILLQINAKLNSQLWQVKHPQLNLKKTMLIGADVFHNTKQKGTKSIIGFVSTLNEDFNQFYSRIQYVGQGQEIMKNVGDLVKDALLKYQQTNKCLPEKIIFFRDGVGEGQFEEVQNVEVQQILEQFIKIDPNYQPEFAEVLVIKRINTRLFDGQKNPPSGVLVCDKITSQKYFDYFLGAQFVTQGTLTPTRYVVVFNNTTLYDNDFYNLTYSQCFNYYNWNGAIKVPSVVQYAHKIAYFVGKAIQKEPEDKYLQQSLYYL